MYKQNVALRFVTLFATKVLAYISSAATKRSCKCEIGSSVHFYFYALLKGSQDNSGNTPEQIVVIDDPVSSMDSDVLFIVSTLIRRLVWDMAEEHSNIRQLFVETHNIYFHKEVSLDRNFPKGTESSLQ